MRYIPALDGVRGAAVAAVLLFHGGHLRGGYLGVDLFFVLSGFLITSLLLAESATSGRIGLRGFWARRARRLLPALALVLAGVAVYAAFVAKAVELHEIRADALATIGYVANWRAVFARTDYWALFAAPSPLQHTWSLAIEEQFYLVWPLVVAAILWQRGRRAEAVDAGATARRVFVVSATGAAASATLGIVLYQVAGSNRVYYGTDTRAAAILLGAALAAWFAWRGPARTPRGRHVVEGLGVSGIVVLALAWTSLGGTSSRLYDGGLFACSLAGLAVIAAAVHPERGVIARSLTLRPLVLLGLISYGVYLWHWPVFVWLNASRAGIRGWPLFAIQVAVTLAVSVASFILVERPIRHGRLRAPQLRLLVPGVAVVLLAALLAATAGYASPAPASATASSFAALARANAPDPSLRLLVVGNSVPFAFTSQGLEQLRTEPALGVFNAASPSCGFPDASEARGSYGNVVRSVPSCSKNWPDVVRVFRPAVVLFNIADILGDLRHDGKWVRPCTPAFDQWFAASLQQATDVLTRYGARLVVATSAYGQFFGVDQRRWNQTDCVNELERAAAARDPRISLIDLGRFICPSRGHCRESVDGFTVRPDGLHFLGPSARWIAAWILPKLGLRAADGRSVSIVTAPR